ncbi:MAG: argininosuccinate synthase domain-containing protein, partial [Candidatus Rokuibacteriota bacterium]
MPESSNDFSARLAGPGGAAAVIPAPLAPRRVVLAYSGGLDTSVILRWLRERYHCEILAFCADVGQGEELLAVRDKALRTGAAAVHIVD